MADESWSDDGWPYGSWRDDGWDDHAAAFPAPAPTSKDIVQNGGRDARDEEMKFQNCKQVRSVINVLSNIYLCNVIYGSYV